MNKRTVIRNDLSLAAPWAALVIIVVLAFLLPCRVDVTEESEARQKEIQVAMTESVPFFIEDWIGQDRLEDVPREAQKLLRPNAIFSRKYRHFGARPGETSTVHIVIVHCGDARDMIGHYPPICYPSSGWIASSIDEPVVTSLTVGQNELPIAVYYYRRMDKSGNETIIRVYNTFILPNGDVTPERKKISKQSERLALSAQGVAQLQIITAISIPQEDAAHAASVLLSGMEELFETMHLAQGGGSET